MEALIARRRMQIKLERASLSPPFRSQSPRYSPHPLHQTPGPGSYGIPSLDYQKTSKYHIASEKKSEIKKQMQWIFGSTRSKGLRLTGQNKGLGPGSYELRDSWHSKPQFWGKGSRFSEKPQDLSLPGPGSYDPRDSEPCQQKQGAISAFKSKTPKTFLGRSVTAEKEEEVVVKLFSPINQEHQSQLEGLPRQKDKSSVFASKVPRFLTQVHNDQIGPGSYDVTPSQKSKRQDFPKLIRSTNILKTGSSCTEERLRVSSEVGPGCYNMRKYEMAHALEFKGQSFARDTRFNFKSRKNRIGSYQPGPGEYMQHKYVYIQPEDSIKSLKQRRQKCFPLKHTQESLQKRISLHKKQDKGPGVYNLDNFDIDFKLRKKMLHQQKLRIMEVSMAAFSSKVPRL